MVVSDRPGSVLEARPRRLAALSLLLAATLLVAPAAPAGASGSADARLIRDLEQAHTLAQRGEICRDLLEGNPSAYARAFCRGYEAILAGRDHDAEEALQEALREQPDFALAAILYGEAYEELKKPETAARYFRWAIELQPRRADARFALGSLYFRRGREEDPKYLAQALEAFREMAEENPSSPDGWSNMGLVLTYMDRFRDAESMFQKAISKDPDNPLFHNNLAALYARENYNDAAEAAFRKALSLNPSYGDAVIELAALYGRTGRLAQAIKTLEEGTASVQAPPWGPRIRRNLGFAYLELDQRGLARQRFEQAAALGTDALAFLGLAHLQMLEDHAGEALASFEKGAELDSAQARPFLQAWRDPLSAAATKETAPTVAALLHDLPPASRETGPAGAEATPALASAALEGWSFAGAESVMEELRGSTRDSTAVPTETTPVPVERVPAEYSDTAQELGEEGTVEILVTVGKDGRVSHARVQACDAPIDLCESALAAARKWVFRPATRFGHPVEAAVVVPFRFSKRN
jgi:TonB family protein